MDSESSSSGSGCNMEIHRLTPLAFLSQQFDEPYALIQLHCPVLSDVVRFKRVWNNATVRILADGAANVILPTLCSDKSFKPTDFLVGDLDSASSKAKEYLGNHGCQIIKVDDQDTTDFTKCLNHVATLPRISLVVCLASTWGRFDHVLGNINSLVMAAANPDLPPVVTLMDENLQVMLPRGHNILDVSTGFEDEYCGFIPIGWPCDHVTTTGLKYNVEDQQLKFGALISTSNSLTDAKHVTVTLDKPLLWTMSVKPFQSGQSSSLNADDH